MLPPLLCLLVSMAAAQTIEGTVLNKTTGRPQPRQEVILYTSAGEQARTTTDETGTFRIESAANQSASSLAVLKAVHDRIEYFEPVTPGKRSDLKVYDVSRQTTGISGYLSLLQFQVKDGVLRVTELHALSNASSPPVTQAGSNNLLLSIPETAKIEPVVVSGPEGGTVQLPLIPVPGQHGQYNVDFPLKPGLTKYAITYQIPYKGEFQFSRRAQYPLRRVGVLIPASMRFHSRETTGFNLVADRPGTQELVLEGLSKGKPLTFELSGIGEFSQSFRAGNAGQTHESDLQSEIERMMAKPWPLSRSSVKEPISNQAPSSPSAASVRWTLFSAILTVAGILLWILLRKRRLSA